MPQKVDSAMQVSQLLHACATVFGLVAVTFSLTVVPVEANPSDEPDPPGTFRYIGADANAARQSSVLTRTAHDQGANAIWSWLSRHAAPFSLNMRFDSLSCHADSEPQTGVKCPVRNKIVSIDAM